MFLAPVIVPNLVRMGRDWDGGYVIGSHAVDSARGLLSFGVNDDWSFESQWHNQRPGDRIHAYDGTIRPGKFDPQLQKEYQQFFGAGATHFPVNVASSTGLGQSSFDDAVLRMNTESIFVKIDIEGGEWQLTDSVVRHADKISGMVIEFHDVHFLRSLFYNTIQRYQEHFHVIHLHPNTSCGYAVDNFPEVVEISFLNRRLWSSDQRRLDCHLPGLDQSNLPDVEDVALYWQM